MKPVDPEVLNGFIREATGYIPTIRSAIVEFRRGNDRHALGEARRLVHTIKGASSMVGLSSLSHIAFFLEEALEEICEEERTLGFASEALFLRTVDRIETYLGNVSMDRADEEALLRSVFIEFRRFRGLPSWDDEKGLRKLLPPGEDGSRSASSAPDGEPETRAAETPGLASELRATSRHPAEHPPAESPGSLPSAETAPTEEVSPELVEAFLLEAEEYLNNIARRLPEWDRDPGRKDLLHIVRRSAHTLKGTAGLVGFHDITRLAHRMEDLLDILYETERKPRPVERELLFATSDALEDLAKQEADDERRREIEALYARYDEILGSEADSADEVAAASTPTASRLDGESPRPPAPLPASAPADTSTPGPAPPAAVTPQPAEVVRVPIERLDELVKLVSEIVINRSAFEQHLGRLGQLTTEHRLSIERLQRIASRLETQYEVRALSSGNKVPVGVGVGAGAEFDELEFDRYTEFHLLLRELTETWSDLGAVASGLAGTVGEFSGISTRQGRLTSDVEDKLMRLRMVPLATLASRLHRTVRVTATSQEKQADLVIEGEDIELDKGVLEDLAEPLLHLLRNAVDHGIEPPELRSAVEKPARGRITLKAYHEGTQVVLEIEDDGVGIDPESLRIAAVRGGFINEADVASLPPEALLDAIFLPGLSTARQLSEISGRGVGLDIVRSSIHKLKGTVRVQSELGEGTKFVVRLPLTLALDRVLLVKVGLETLAMPLGAVTQILRAGENAIESLGHRPVLRLDGTVYPVVHLSEVIAMDAGIKEPEETAPVLLVNTGGRVVAVLVDALLEAREVVVKTLGTHLRKVKGVTGGTLLGDGSVVLILNPAELDPDAASSGAALWETKSIARRGPLEVLIVDDSLSVRNVLSSLIQKAGWNPVTATDGVEALELIQRSPKPPDVVLLDIEMPRMDGYELTAALRGQDTTRELPIVMLTSRAGEKHRRKAFDLGANEYLVKPYQDEELLSVVKRATAARMPDES